MVAANVGGVGNYTDYHSNKITIALQVSFRDGRTTEHTIIHSGACKSENQIVPEYSEAGNLGINGLRGTGNGGFLHSMNTAVIIRFFSVMFCVI